MKYWLPLLVFIFVPASAPFAAAANSRTSMGITGCNPQARTQAGTSDGRIVFAGCAGPNGLFYSRDQGTTWTFAGEGTLYTDGRSGPVLLTEEYVYISPNPERDGLLRAKLPAAAGESWSLHWEKAQNGEGLEVRARLGRFLIAESQVHTSPGRDDWYVKAYDTATAAVVSTLAMPSELQPEPGDYSADFDVQPGGDGTFVFATTGINYSTPSATQTAALYRAAFNPSTGQLGAGWEKTQLMTNGAPAAPGLPARYEGVDAYGLKEIAIAPHNEVFVAFPMTQTGPGGCNQPIYVSTDYGTNFVQKTFTGLGYCTPLRGVSFAGDNYLFETFFSRDAGQTWQQLSAPGDWQTRLSVSLDASVTYLEPNGRWALLRTNIGYARVNLPAAGAPADTDWSVTSGFLAIDLYQLAKGHQNPNFAVIRSAGGYSITQNFLSESPTWLPNYCPNGECFGGRAVAADPGNASIFYLAGNPYVFKLTTNSSGDPRTYSLEQYISKSQALPAKDDLAQYGVLYTNPTALPNTLVMTLQSELAGEDVGGIFFYDLTRPACSTDYRACPGPDKTAVIKPASGAETSSGVRISSFIAISSSVMFAAAGNRYAQPGSYKAVLRSTDEGATFHEMSNFARDAQGNPVQNAQPTSFAYDPRSDILYASYSISADSMQVPGSVAVLKNASKGNTGWEKGVRLPTDTRPGETTYITVSSLAVDALTGQVAAGGQQDMKARMWTSDDFGKTWVLAGKGQNEENINFLSYDEVVQGSALGARAKRSRVVQGSSTGLYAVTASGANCSVVIAGACKKKVPRGAVCKLTAAMKAASATRKTKVSLQRASTSAGPFKRVMPFSALSKGKKSFSVKAAPGYYRAVFSAPACTTKTLRIQVK